MNSEPKIDPTPFGVSDPFEHLRESAKSADQLRASAPPREPSPNLCPSAQSVDHLSSPSGVSRIAIARLFNLGRFEHVRYEITLDLSPSDPSPADTFKRLANTM